MVQLAANALATVTAEFRNELGITDEEEDAKLRRLINAASAMISKRTQREFYRDTAIVERIESRGTRFLMVERTPLNSITSIVYDGDTVDPDSYEIHDAEAGIIAFVGSTWPWRPIAARDPTLAPLPGTERRLHTVTYDGGYYTQKQIDEDATGLLVRSLPYDLEEACLELARTMYVGKSRDPSIKAEKLMSWSATYAGDGKDSDDMPASVRRAVDPYKRVDW